MHASAIHSLLSPEHRPECVPLVGPLFDEVFETIDHALHDLLFGFAFVKIERAIEVNGVSTRRRTELRRRDEGRAGLERDRGWAAGHDGVPPKKAHGHAGALLEVAK